MENIFWRSQNRRICPQKCPTGRGPASFLGVSGVENGKRDYTSHQGVSRNEQWERLALTQRTLGRVNEKNETPRRFGSISV